MTEPTDKAEAATRVPEGVAESAPSLGSSIQEDLLDSVLFSTLPDWAQNWLEFLSSYPILMLLVVISLGYLLGKFLQFLTSSVMGHFASKTKTDFDDRLLAVLRTPMLTVPMNLALLMVTSLLPLSSGAHNFIVGTLATVILFSLLRASLKATHVFLEILAAHEGKHDLIQPRTMPMFEITAKIMLVALAVYVVLLIWGVNPSAWLASAGVIGIAVGFAARDTLANLFSGIFIVADAPYKIGDFVVLDTGERGEVTGLGMRSTRLLTRDDVEITIPNAIIANAKIINESGGPWEKHRIRIPLGVAYGSDLDEVVEVLMNVAADCTEIINYPAPRVRLRTFGASSVDFELMGWIEKPESRGRVKHELLMSIYKEFAARDIQIPFPQTDVHLKPMNTGDGKETRSDEPSEAAPE